MRRRKKKERNKKRLSRTLAAIPSYHLCNTRTLYLATDNNHGIYLDKISVHVHVHVHTRHTSSSPLANTITARHTKTIQNNNNKPADHTTLHQPTDQRLPPAYPGSPPSPGPAPPHQIQSVLAHLVTPARGARIPARLTGLCRACH